MRKWLVLVGAALVALVAMLDDGDFQKPPLFTDRLARRG